jgi:transposase-like protein
MSGSTRYSPELRERAVRMVIDSAMRSGASMDNMSRERANFDKG